jgi:polysaccharide biosynthesis/export protein
MTITSKWINRMQGAKATTVPAASLLVALLCLNASAQTGSTQSAEALPVVTPYGTTQINAGQLVLGPGDLITVQVFNTPELSGNLRVDQSGSILLPIGGLLDVTGQTTAQASAAIEKRLRDAQIMLDPHVNVLVTQYATQGITILGEVKLPGIYPVYGAHSLYDLLAVAGGPTASEGSTITITHHRDPEHPLVVQVNTPNYSAVQRSTPVAPGDTVVVSKADLIYVVGDVNKPGPVPIMNGQSTSVLNILTLSGGLNLTAAATTAAIIRETPTGVQTIPLDIDKIMRSTAPNPVLQASDVLVVPHSGTKTFMQFALPNAASAVTNAVADYLILR